MIPRLLGRRRIHISYGSELGRSPGLTPISTLVVGIGKDDLSVQEAENRGSRKLGFPVDRATLAIASRRTGAFLSLDDIMTGGSAESVICIAIWRTGEPNYAGQ